MRVLKLTVGLKSWKLNKKLGIFHHTFEFRDMTIKMEAFSGFWAHETNNR